MILELLQATSSALPDSLWEKYPIIGILAFVLFFQGREMRKLGEQVASLAAEMRALMEHCKGGKS